MQCFVLFGLKLTQQLLWPFSGYIGFCSHYTFSYIQAFLIQLRPLVLLLDHVHHGQADEAADGENIVQPAGSNIWDEEDKEEKHGDHTKAEEI